jgi:transposase
MSVRTVGDQLKRRNMKRTVYVGGDVSKGYVDVHVADAEGKKLGRKKLVDMAAGHEALLTMLRRLADDAHVVFAVEATGGYERNWLRTACEMRDELQCQVFQVNAQSVKKYLDSRLHRNVNDKAAAAGICDYLRDKLPRSEYQGTGDEGVKTLCRLALATVEQVASLKTRLLMLLSSTAPELVQYARNDMPVWMPALLRQYGSATELAAAEAEDVQRIVSESVDARKLILDAKSSVASMTDEASATAVKWLATSLCQAELLAKYRKDVVVSLTKAREDVARVASIPGIGDWTAAVLVLETGGFDRFPTPEAITAFVGLDPRVDTSGDGKKFKRISRHGSSRVRAALYMPALSAIKCNPLIRDFYHRLVNNGTSGNKAVVAAMRKLLILAWACGRTGGRSFDPNYESARRLEKAATPKTEPRDTVELDPAAPVSRRALKRSLEGVVKQRAKQRSLGAEQISPARKTSAPVSRRTPKRRRK